MIRCAIILRRWYASRSVLNSPARVFGCSGGGMLIVTVLVGISPLTEMSASAPSGASVNFHNAGA